MANTTATPPAYAELMALSHFSFQVGASSPEALVTRASELGYSALALTDVCSVAGVVRAHVQAKQLGLTFLPGASFTWPDGWRLVALPQNITGWSALCRLITQARTGTIQGDGVSTTPEDVPVDEEDRVEKGLVRMPPWPQVARQLTDCALILIPPRLPVGTPTTTLDAVAQRLTAWQTQLSTQAPARLWIGAVLHQQADDDWWQQQLKIWEIETRIPVVCVGDARMHVRAKKPLLDVVTAIGLRRPLRDCGSALVGNAQMHLRRRWHLARLVPSTWLTRSVAVMQSCRFSLDDIKYRYPTESVAPGETPTQTLARLTQAGLLMRYPSGIPERVQAQIKHELSLINDLSYEMYFLTVHDLVRFARERGILCQGRGSAANSAVCYALGITEVDPAKSTLLFERFISRARKEPPDIDVDFEHQRREEVIQYIYQKYGRDRAAITATVMTYRPRSALRDVGKALGVDERLVQAFCKAHPGMYARTIQQAALDEVLERIQMTAQTPAHYAQWLLWLDLAGQLMGAPRQLGQHSGGFVLTQGRLTDLVPIENARMPARSLIQWDKDDLDAVGLLKVDVLALGMLSAIQRCLTLVGQQRGLSGPLPIQAIPAEDPATYEMLCRADSIGVFQVESRAQMSMLPRLKPRCFYDLVVQVAIVRPGPIQGGMVHPYLRRRQGIEPVSYPGPALKQALGRTLGVPIFQEQVMQIAMLAAGFTAEEADQLRRSMAAWKRKGGVEKFYDRIVSGMVAHGYSVAFADQIFQQIQGFGEYGFPESHAASFALLVYVSAWLKRHEPACFLAAMLNSLPMGFYGPSQLVQDAQRHGVTVLPVDVVHSDWDSTVGAHQTVRLGLNRVSGLSERGAHRLVMARSEAPFASVVDLAERAALNQSDINQLAQADALHSLAGHRRLQWWASTAAHDRVAALGGAATAVSAIDAEDAASWLPEASVGEAVVQDYASTALSLRAHPVGLLRDRLAAKRLMPAAVLHTYPDRRLARAAGLVTVRQRPGTAKGVLFLTLEDETGVVNVVAWQSLQAQPQQRHALMGARLLAVYGVWQRDTDVRTGEPGQVMHLIAKRVVDLSDWLSELTTLESKPLRYPTHEFH